MIDLYNADTNQLVGQLSEAELKHLTTHFELESTRDTDLYIQQGSLELLTDNGEATDHLLGLLRSVLGTSEGVNIRWETR